ncbi:MAG: NUDIX hydrolase [Deltaproteobacteria bacterium]|nr:MAG: NUDIX hydrolase [Deltaproteobacteria bacterium]
MQQKTHCPYCGTRLEDRFVEGRTRRYCASCNEPIYENPVPATCLVVVDPADRILLVKRNVPPKIGHWCLPGGFVEVDEAPEAAALRELKEEAGLNAEIDALLGVRSHTSAFFGCVIIIGYLVKTFSGVPTPGDDASDALFFDPSEMPDIAFNTHASLIAAYQSRSGDQTWPCTG